MTLEIGAHLGHYRIIALLGRGGMADVYRAQDERLGREVALKAIPPEFARDPERIERFRREVRAAASLNHSHIVTVYEFGQGEGQHFFTMELMPGGDLKARIRAQPEGMDPVEARSVALAMARALDYAHRQGFVHRDVKPENILFGGEGSPKLTDFGIVRAMSEGTGITAKGMSIGSPRYMSPEQARGLKVDGRSDLYSLGVVLYEMLTGRLPFDAGDTFSVALSHINDPAPQLPAALEEWQPLLDRLLAKSPQDRYAGAGELAKALGSEGGARESATRVTAAGPTRSPSSRARDEKTRLVEASKPRRALASWLAGGVLALAAVGIGYLALQNAKGPEPAPSGGGGQSAEVGPAPVTSAPQSPDPSAETGNPYALDRPKPAREASSRPRPTRPQARRTAPSQPTPRSSLAVSKAARRGTKPLPVLGGRSLLVVETTPAGAEVLVDGVSVGKTPLERSDIRAGARQVTLRHPHCETVSENGRRFEDGRVVRIRRTLVRGRGALTVTASPREAWVEVDGKRVADSTPATVENLPAGRVEVKLGAPEHHALALV